MPNHGSKDAYFSATSTSAARVFVSCGVMSVLRHSARTRMSSPPRIGSGTIFTGRSTTSEASPGAWFVLEPSNPQMGGSSPSAKTLVFDRRRCVGCVPSVQMYIARYAMSSSLSRRLQWRRRPPPRSTKGGAYIRPPFDHVRSAQFPTRCRIVNSVFQPRRTAKSG